MEPAMHLDKPQTDASLEHFQAGRLAAANPKFADVECPIVAATLNGYHFVGRSRLAFVKGFKAQRAEA